MTVQSERSLYGLHAQKLVQAVHLIVPAPIGQSTIDITLRGLLTEWARYYNRFEFIAPQILPSINANWGGPKRVRHA